MSKRRRRSKNKLRNTKDLTYDDWMDSYPHVHGWMKQYDLDALLEAGHGFVKISGFLPTFVAEGALSVLERLKEDVWDTRDSETEYQVKFHKFWATKQEVPEVEKLIRVLSLLYPEKVHSFQASRYNQGDYITAHNDKGYQTVQMVSGEKVLHSRDIACVYYLTKDWDPGYGGLFRDLEADVTYVPEFNSLIAFRVPRYHEVLPVLTEKRRFAIFGWFLEAGVLYEMDSEEEEKGEKKDVENEAKSEKEKGDEKRVKRKKGTKKGRKGRGFIKKGLKRNRTTIVRKF